MIKISSMKEIVRTLNEWADAYYVKDNPLVSDKEYDDLYDLLLKYEKESGIILSNSPTQRVQGKVLDSFQKIKHTKPMLSAAKTKSVSDITKWLNNRQYYCSFKLDGLTLVCTYQNGELVKAVTRGDGIFGEDVTEQARMLSNLPLHIPYKEELVVRGECVVDWETFDTINKGLQDPFSHPRNMAAGTLRNLNTDIVRSRNLLFVLFECVTDIGLDDKVDVLQAMYQIGFTIVPFSYDADNIDKYVETMSPECSVYPVDGLIFELKSRQESLQTTSTAHHEGCRMALKWADETVETELEDIEWNTTRTGLVAPVAIFKQVTLDGSNITRATLHNVSILKNLKLGIGDKITVYKSNMIIPTIDQNLTMSDTYKLPERCPTCGAPLELRTSDSGTQNLYCSNDQCGAKLINRLTHFVSKHAMNIEGLSSAIITFLIENNFVEDFIDIYKLKSYRDSLCEYSGFGEKSVDKLLSSIDKSRTTTLDKFLVSLGIPNVGRTASKAISKYFGGNVRDFFQNIETFDFTTLGDFGAIMDASIKNWYRNVNVGKMYDLIAELDFVVPTASSNSLIFDGKVIAVTGKLQHFTRDSINEKIESLGGKPASSVSSKTNYLVNNDPDSPSSKNKKAKELNVPIITEEEFIDLIGGIE